MIDPLVALLVVIVVLAIIFYVLSKMTIEPGLRNIIYLVILVFVIILLLRFFGLF